MPTVETLRSALADHPDGSPTLAIGLAAKLGLTA